MKAVIMAGGEGTRLRPLTCNRPKPMVPVVNRPIMEHIIGLLKKHGLTDIAVTLQYMPEVIRDYFGDGEEFGVNIRYYIEKTPLGTAGSVKNAEDFLKDTFVVISGDALTDINLEKAVQFHKDKGSVATLVLKKVNIPLEYGVVITDEEGRITRFVEKPGWGEVFSDTVNTGIYILSPEVLSYFKAGEMFDFSKDLFPILLREKKPMFGYVTDDYWCDIGDLGAYTRAHEDVMEGRVRIDIPGIQIRNKVWVGEGTDLNDDVFVEGPCVIGQNVTIRKNAVLGAYTVIGDNCKIGERSSVKRSIIWRGCRIDNNVQLRGSVLCSRTHFRDGAAAFENSVIGDSTVINEDAFVKPSIKIWPEKIVEAGVEVTSNLVWGAKITRSIFGNRGIAGELNVDITPEYASKLGAAYGATFKRVPRIAVSNDGSAPARMLTLSFISGLLSSGAEVYDFGIMPLPVTRSAIRFYRTDGGIYISTSPVGNTRLFIDFLDEKGANITRDLERKIENVFWREDFSRCEAENIKEIRNISGYIDFYFRKIINGVKSGKMNFKVALNSKSDFIVEKMTELLKELGCEVETVRSDIFSPMTKQNDLKRFINSLRLHKFDIGVSIEETSEKMTLVDNRGRVVTDDMFTALVSLICLKSVKGTTVCVPVSASRIVEKMAMEHNGKVIRTKTSLKDYMNRILGNDENGEMNDQFVMYFDAMAGLVKILDFMNLHKYTLADLVDMIPNFHIIRKEVPCPWDAKGKVMRKLIEESGGEKLETIEGVKIYQGNDGWVLVLPDGEKPVCKVIGEGYTEEFAEELTDIYVKKIKDISQ